MVPILLQKYELGIPIAAAPPFAGVIIGAHASTIPYILDPKPRDAVPGSEDTNFLVTDVGIPRTMVSPGGDQNGGQRRCQQWNPLKHSPVELNRNSARSNRNQHQPHHTTHNRSGKPDQFLTTVQLAGVTRVAGFWHADPATEKPEGQD